MPVATRYIFVVSMDVEPDKEALFNEVYDKEHIPFISQVPGVRGAYRMQGEDFRMQLGGDVQVKKHDGPRYTAVYEIDSPDVLMSPEWAKQAEKGRWPGEVRPFTKNRRHAIYRIR